MGDAHAPNLDVLRAAAVACVVCSHLLLDHSFTRIGAYHTQTLGTLGVMVFFVHTCLVLMRSLERMERAAPRRPLALAFLANRIFRIYPLSVCVVLALAAAEGAGAHGGFAPSVVASNVLLVQNLTGSASVTPVLWSLPFEVQMYLFLPALYRWAGAGAPRPWRRVLALWAASVAAVALLWRLGVDVDLVKFFPCFLPGVLAYALRDARRTWPAGVLFAYVGANAVAYPLLVGLGASATVLSWAVCVGLGALLPRCADVAAPWLKTGSRVVARYSYGIYLVHVTVMNLVFHRLAGLPAALAWPLFAAGVAGLAFALHHLVEKPGIDCGHWLADRVAPGRRRAAQNI